MTNAQILAACRSNWEYRGVDGASLREMLDELSAHLEDAEAAGRSAQDVVGRDVRAFAASWARARAPLSRRAPRAVAIACFVAGWLLLGAYLIRWTTEVDVTAAFLAFWLATGTATVAWELRRGNIGLRKSWLVGLAVGLPAAVLTMWLVGDGVLFTLPLWAAPLLLLPGLPYAVADARAARRVRRKAEDGAPELS
ncbi:hypothetical protein ABT237_03720 [Streptomyces sp. NPDC001581]|uniref:hypothetical protein n=1 Tax=Streptomyces sp. NPDC001581 TaxID=3154386 RepID=UPI00332B2C90